MTTALLCISVLVAPVNAERAVKPAKVPNACYRDPVAAAPQQPRLARWSCMIPGTRKLCHLPLEGGSRKIENSSNRETLFSYTAHSPCHDKHCQAKEIRIAKPATDVRDAVVAYYEAKYDLSDEADNKDPVTGIVNSWPYGPFFTILERTERSKTEIDVTELRFYSDDEKSCRVVLSVFTLDKAEDLPYSTRDPITDDELRDLAVASKAEIATPDRSVWEGCPVCSGASRCVCTQERQVMGTRRKRHRR